MTKTWALQSHQASSTSKVWCEIPARGFGYDWYAMTMYVDTLKVNHWMPNLYFKNHKTPKIKELPDHRYVKVNSVVDFWGEFYTDVYGNSQGPKNSNDDIDYSIELVGVFVGPKECEMVSDQFVIPNNTYLI